MNFVAVDFETANPQRVSACSIGIAIVKSGDVLGSFEYLIKPVGGHASFQSRIHGICDSHTQGKPNFAEMFEQIKSDLGENIFGYSLFDKQVLESLLEYYSIEHSFIYTDVRNLVKKAFPDLPNYRLPTVAKQLGINIGRHHCAKDDAVTCAKVAVSVSNGHKPQRGITSASMHILKGLVAGVLADGELNYREAAEILYFLEENPEMLSKYGVLRDTLYSCLEDGILTQNESDILQREISAINEAQ